MGKGIFSYHNELQTCWQMKTVKVSERHGRLKNSAGWVECNETQHNLFQKCWVSLHSTQSIVFKKTFLELPILKHLVVNSFFCNFSKIVFLKSILTIKLKE
jgi:hypothetical protein